MPSDGGIVMSNKDIELDKYYTPIETANFCWDKVQEVIGFNNISEIIEPSCGNGAFYHHPLYTPHFGYDIEPEYYTDCGVIEQANFLEIDINYLYGRLFIGNPPFGYRNSLAIKFYNKCCELGDYVAFILPISQLNNNLQMYKFDLVASYDLGVLPYSGVNLHCCFNIYKRPETGKLNSKPCVELKDVTIVEHRRKKGQYATAKNKKIAPNYDYAMCNWGSGCLGKVPQYVGEYAQEVYFYCHNKKYLKQLLELLKPEVIRSYVNSISAKKISVARLYVYIKDNIEGIE